MFKTKIEKRINDRRFKKAAAKATKTGEIQTMKNFKYPDRKSSRKTNKKNII